MLANVLRNLFYIGNTKDRATKGILLSSLAIYTVTYFVHGVFHYPAYGDLLLVIDWAKKWYFTGELWNEFGAYTPFSMLLVLPFVKSSENQIAVAMHLINFFCLGLIFYLSCTWVEKKYRTSFLFLSFILILNFRPLLLGLSMIKVEFIELALIFLAIHFFNKGNDVLTGACLAVGAAIKFIPGFVLAYFLWKRQWKVVFWGAVVGLLTLFVTVPVFGWAYHLTYAKLLFSGGITEWVDNQSLEAAVYRWFAPFPPVSTYPEVKVLPAFVPWLVRSVKITSLIFLFWISKNRISSRGDSRLVWEISLWLLAIPLFLKFYRDYYSVFFLPLVFLVIQEIFETKITDSQILLFLVAYLFMGQGLPIGIFTRLPEVYPGYSNYHLYLYLSLPFYGTFLWGVLTAWTLKSNQRRERA